MDFVTVESSAFGAPNTLCLRITIFDFWRFKKMSIGTILSDSLKYPFFNIKRVTGFILLLLGSIFIIPAIMALGYILRIIEHTTHGSNELPPFDEWGKMFKDGLKYIAVTMIFLIIPNILMIVVSPGILTLYSGGFQIGMYLLSNIIGLIIFTPFRMIYFMAIGNMAYKRQFDGIFEFNNIIKFIRAIGWLKYMLYLLVFAIIGDLFSMFSSIVQYLLISQGWVVIQKGGSLPGIQKGNSLLIHEGGFLLFITSFIISIYLIIYGARFIGLIYRKGSQLIKTDQETENNTEIKENQDMGTI